jgi:hypothetical protein
MNFGDLRRALERLSGDGDDDEGGIARIVRSAVEEGRSAGEAAVALWLETGPLSRRAHTVLLALEDLGLAPLAGSRIPAEPHVRSLRMLAIARATRAAQTRAVHALFAALDDTAELAPDESGALRRVCDEAYLHLRDLLFADGTAVRTAVTADAFLQLPKEERDELVREAKASRVFRRLIDDVDVDP